MSDHDDVVQRQFGAQAAAYLSSAVHAQGEEFALLRDALAGRPEARVLDLGCGAGHVSFQVAALAGRWWPTIFPPRCSPWWRRAPRNGAWRTSAPSRARRRACPSPTASSISSSVAIPPITGATSAWPCARCDGCSSPAGGDLRRRGGARAGLAGHLPADRRAAPRHQPCAQLLAGRVGAPERRGGLAGRRKPAPAPAPGVPVVGRADAYAGGVPPGDPQPAAGGGRGSQEYFEIADDGSFSTDVLVLWLRRE